MKRTIYLNSINKLRERIDRNSQLIQVVLGPRQVGKTTTVLKLIDENYKNRSYYVSADGIFNADHSWLYEQWNIAQSENKILFIDEIQKCPNWAEAIKSLFDESKRKNKNIACVLLGSSSLEIQKGLTESLTGRFQIIQAYHWNFQESQEGYGLSFDDYLHYGGYPGSYQFVGKKDWVDYVKNSIISTVIEKDILQFNHVKSPSLFRQAFELLVSYPAQEISYTKLLGQLQDKGNVELIKNYIALYEGAYLLKALEKFSTKPVIKKSSSPKILPLAPCLPYIQSRMKYNPEEEGRIFELLVGSQLVRTGEELFYWREASYEVDYIVKAGRKVWAVEVKSGRKKNAQGINKFKEKFPDATILFITKENYHEFEQEPMKFLEKAL